MVIVTSEKKPENGRIWFGILLIQCPGRGLMLSMTRQKLVIHGQ